MTPFVSKRQYRFEMNVVTNRDTDRPMQFGERFATPRIRRRVLTLRFVPALRIAAMHRVLPHHVTCYALITFSIRSLPLSNETGGR